MGEFPPPTVVDPVRAQRWSDAPKWLKVVAVVAGLSVVGTIASLFEDDDEFDTSTLGGRIQAHAMCAEFTRDRLKAPATADFPEYDDADVSITGGAGRWVVLSFVDAENGFGANVRTHFRCEVTDLGEQWRLESWTDR